MPMKNISLLLGMLALPLLLSAQVKDFVKGADVSGLPRQEKYGVKFHDREGH